ncbi:MAG: hypothetical protein KDG49_15220 [Geminicoccaceae bacterium]|nr:hypothetical protein [Geminicoccaceae bacterium]
MRPVLCTLAALLVLAAAACAPDRFEEEQARAAEDQRLDSLGSFEECVDNAGEDLADVEACQSLTPAPSNM